MNGCAAFKRIDGNGLNDGFMIRIAVKPEEVKFVKASIATRNLTS